LGGEAVGWNYPFEKCRPRKILSRTQIFTDVQFKPGGYLIPTSTIPSSIARIIAGVAFQAGGSHEVFRVAVITGGTLMVDTTTLATTIGVCRVEAGWGPGRSIMALVTRHIGEQTGMEGRVGVAGRTG
jgi:hypothetical protein